MHGCRNPLHCFLPPFVLENVARNGEQHQREWALRSLASDQTIRAARLQNASVRGRGPREGADALAAQAHVIGTANRLIWDAKEQETIPTGAPVWREGEKAAKDKAVNDASDGLGQTFDFYASQYGRDSIDGDGMPLRGVVHFGKSYDNAFWDGRRMVFGDGDGELFTSLTGSLDVIGHELTHGVTEDETGMQYLGQSGALNESISDVFGSLVKQHKKGQKAEQADWLIGVDVFTPKIKGDALRSMKAPGTAYDDPVLGKDPQPAHMKDFVKTSEDNGGVHTNSGIPNHAFYVVATTLKGPAWEVAGRIWYETLLLPELKPTVDFRGFARLTVRVAERLYGKGKERDAVREGWTKVGVKI